jgi:hypothetical protein
MFCKCISIYFYTSYNQSFSNGYVSLLRLGFFWEHMFKNQSRCLCKKQGAAAHPETSLGVLKCPKICGKRYVTLSWGLLCPNCQTRHDSRLKELPMQLNLWVKSNYNMGWDHKVNTLLLFLHQSKKRTLNL